MPLSDKDIKRLVVGKHKQDKNLIQQLKDYFSSSPAILIYFSFKNITSIVGSSGNKSNIFERLQLLNTNIDTFSRMDPLTAQNISSMLHGSGQSLGNNIKELIELTTPLRQADGSLMHNIHGQPLTKLSYLISQGLTAQNISSMLHGAGHQLPEKITALFKFHYVDVFSVEPDLTTHDSGISVSADHQVQSKTNTSNSIQAISPQGNSVFLKRRHAQACSVSTNESSSSASQSTHQLSRHSFFGALNAAHTPVAISNSEPLDLTTKKLRSQ